MAYTKLIARHTENARVEKISPESFHYLLSIPSGNANSYRLAQLDDYTKLRRGQFPFRSPLSFSLSARTSSNSLPGTWGFGLWNDPFGLSLGFGGNPFRLPALPNAVWFFGASEESYLSFRKVGQGGLNPTVYGNGFLAQSFRSPRFHPLLIAAGLSLPFSRKKARRSLAQVIQDDGTHLSMDPTQWHRYKIDWRENRVSFEVDDALAFESRTSPNTPLGVVIWIDNQFAAFTPEGRIGFGVLENPEPAWLEVDGIEIMT